MGILNIISFIIFNSFFFDLLSYLVAYYLPVVGVGVGGIPVYQAGGVKKMFDVPHELPTLVILVPPAWIPVPV
jgi:hypothetical protein